MRGFSRPVYYVGVGQLINVFGAGLVYPFATIHFHLVVGIALSLVGIGLLANSVATGAGLTLGLYAPASHAMIADVTTGEERDRGYALLKVANDAGFGLGFVVGGAFFDFGFRWALWPVLIVLCGLLAVGVLVLERRLSPAENGVSTEETDGAVTAQ